MRPIRRSALWLSGVLIAATLVTGLELGRVDAAPVVRTVAVGRAPWRVVVDERSDRAFVVNRGDGTVSVLDGATGALLRTLTVGDQPIAAAVDQATGRVFVANDADGTVSVLDARGERVVNTVPVGTDPQWLAVDEGTDRVFVPNRSDNTVSVLDARTGTVLRTVAVALFPFAVAVDARTNRVFVRCNSGRVVVLDARSGAVLRTTRVGSAPWGQLAVDQRTARVFVTNPHNQTVNVLDARDGRLVRTVAVGMEAYRPVVDARAGIVVVAGPNKTRGRVSVLDARSGALLRTVAAGYAPWPALAATGNGTILVDVVGKTDIMGNALGTGTVDVLDAGHGSVRRTVPAGVFPIDVAVDERTGRAFVVNYTARWSDGGPVTVARRVWWAPLQGWLAARLPVVPPPRQPTAPANGSVTVLDLSRL